MKQKLYIALMGLATMLIVVLPYVPHHHHEGAVCMTTEHCDSDNQDNDRHTHHSDQGGEICIENANFLIAKHSSSSNVDYLPALLSTVIAHIITLSDTVSDEEVALCTPWVNDYLSADLCGGMGLRAPPMA